MIFNAYIHRLHHSYLAANSQLLGTALQSLSRICTLSADSMLHKLKKEV
jgi:hypothetical protein